MDASVSTVLGRDVNGHPPGTNPASVASDVDPQLVVGQTEAVVEMITSAQRLCSGRAGVMPQGDTLILFFFFFFYPLLPTMQLIPEEDFSIFQPNSYFLVF